MIEASLDLQHILRDFQRDGNIAVRRAQRSSLVGERREQDTVSVRQADSAEPAGETEERGRSAVVNFELLPSGELQLNQEERQHIINFFD